MLEFFNRVIKLISDVLTILTKTASNIDSVQFNETVFHDYLGYARFVMGDPLYSLFMLTIEIAIGVSLWIFLIKVISLLHDMTI